MLIEFTVGNFRSIKEPVTLSMLAAKLVSKEKKLDEQNTFQAGQLRLLRTAAIYGANASGKTNLALAANFMRDLILNSSRETRLEDPIAIEPFRLSTETQEAASFFEVIFLLGDKRYRYGFEVAPDRIISEWLYSVPGSREAALFLRDEDGIKVYDRFREGKGIESRTRANALFLSVVAQFNGEIASRILGWFRLFKVNLGVNHDLELHRATFAFDRMSERQAVLRFIEELDLGISDIQAEKKEFPWPRAGEGSKELLEAIARLMGGQVPTEIPAIRTVHQKYDSSGNVVGTEIFALDEQESAGTRRLFSLALPVLEALEFGRAMFIDEMDARLHPLIMDAIIDLFNSTEKNPNNAQLIFTTHNVGLLSNKRFRRDQIWFVEKDKFGASHLYSLAEFKVRNDSSFEQDYMRGRYGAVPYVVGDLTWIAGGSDGEE